MKTRRFLVAALTILASDAAMPAGLPGMSMDKTPGTATEQAQTHHSMGVVKAVDVAKGTITLSHEPVPSLKWPAMTMAFKAGKAQVAGVKAGDRVNFSFVSKEMDGTIATISKAK